ncbi:MAG TPA: methyl-accepting chemotaxis protein, partial [Nitrospirota bacterium]
GLKSLKDKIRSIKVGETGYIYALDGKEGPTYGTLVVHPAKEGTNILDSKDADGREFIKEILQKKNGIIRYPWLNKELRETKAREKIVVYAPYDNWNWVIGTGMYVEDFTRITDSILKYMLWGGLILTTLLVLLVYWCSRYFVYHPLKKAVDFATAVAEGDLTQSIESEWNDEAGRLAQALDKMAHRLRELISVVKTSADDVAFGSQQLNQKSENISSGALIQASAADQTSSSMEEMSASFKSVSESAECLAENVQETSSTIMEMTRSFDKVSSDAEMLSSSVSDTSRTIKQMTASIDHIAKNADMLTGTVAETSSTIKEMAASISQVDGNTSDASQLSHKAALDAKAGSDAVERAIEGISRIAEVMDENYKVIGTLSKRSVDIGMIVEVIEDIADQTKLLALNATIEAAKAGAEGRGFAVVAQEVKNLANRSVSATSEIGKLIKQVQIETANAVKTTEAASHETKEGIKLADKAGESLKRILESVGATNEIMSAIANATQEQSLAATQMLKLVEDMVHSTDQVTNAVKEQSSGTDHIRTAIENINLITIQVAHAMKEQTVAGNRILQAVETMNSMTQQVANATTEQKYTGEVVVKAIEQITDIARDNLKAVQELSRASQDMTSRAVAMHQAINAFKTGSEMTMS